MQRVVRSTLVGLLTIAGLTACGDKVTLPPPVTTVPTAVVHQVIVSPNAASISVGGTFTFAASVDADAGVSNRTVTWSSSDATVASVDAGGKVTGNKAGTVSIKATSAADPSVSGAASVTVGGPVGGGQLLVQIVSVLQNVGAGVEQPANVLGAFGQLDINVNVDAGGQTLKTAGVTLKVGNDSLTQVQTFASNSAPVAAEAAASVLTFSFNTAQFNPTTGVPALHNGTMTITAFATSTSTTTPSASSTVTYQLLNADGVLITPSFASYTNAEGKATITSAIDANNLPWKGGAVTLLALPVLYSGRTVALLTLTLPGATVPSVGLTAAPYSQTWSATSTSASTPNVTQKTLFGAGFEFGTTTPLPVQPTASAIDAVGNDVPLTILNPGNNTGGSAFRLDNGAPAPPLVFTIAGRQTSITGGWINGTYTFTGTGGTSFTNTGTTKFVSCGDGPSPGAYATMPATVVAPAVFPTCASDGVVQQGVSVSSVSGTTGLASGTTLSYYTIPAASYVAASGTNGTSTSATACSITGWTAVTPGTISLAGTALGNAYVVRLFETDKLGNTRCTDLASAGSNGSINNGAWAQGTFGVDLIAPTAAYINTAADPTATSANGIWNAASVGTVPANFLVKIGYSDDASQPSGFQTLPMTTTVQRLFIDPVTGVASVPSANACPTGFSSNSGTCVSTSAAANVPGWFNATAGALADKSGCVGCGYYVFQQQLFDIARNAATTFGPTSAATLSVLGGAACPANFGCRQLLIDTQAPVPGGVAIPATIVGGSTALFASSATDNLDLGTYDYTLLIPANPGGNPIATLPIRSPATASNNQNIGTAFDNVLTTTASFNVTIPQFIRNLATTTSVAPVDAPQNNGVIPTNLTVRVYDAAGNPGAPVNQPISAVNIPQAGVTNYAAFQPNATTALPACTAALCAQMSSFAVTNAATNISNGPTTPATNPTTVTLTANLVGTEAPTFQYINPFTQVQFYYFDTVTGEYIFIGSAAASTVTDNATVTLRTFTYSFANWDPPASLGNGVTAKIIAVGINAAGDALATQVNANITLTNP